MRKFDRISGIVVVDGYIAALTVGWANREEFFNNLKKEGFNPKKSAHFYEINYLSNNQPVLHLTAIERGYNDPKNI